MFRGVDRREVHRAVWPLQRRGDTTYRANSIDALGEKFNIPPVIPSKKNETNAQVRFFDRKAYRRRNVIERLVAKLKEMLAIRYDKLKIMDEHMICLGFIVSYLRTSSKRPKRRFSDTAKEPVKSR